MDPVFWNECTDPKVMLKQLTDKTFERKRQLFSFACCRRVTHLLTPRSARIVAAREAQAAGLVIWEDMWMPQNRVRIPASPRRWSAGWAARHAWEGGQWAEHAASCAVNAVKADTSPDVQEAVAAAERAAQAELVREIFGPHPWQPVVLEPAWPKGNWVPLLAESAFEWPDRLTGWLDRERLDVLVEFLERGGCRNDALLEHLRSPAPHVRGCFAIDALLGRS